jgi:hypothetical protein
MAAFRPMLRGRRCVPPKGRYDANVDLGLAEYRRIRSKRDVRCLHQLASAAEGQPVYCGDDRLRIGFNAPRHLMAGPHEFHDGLLRTSLQVTLKARDVGASTEGASSASNYDDANGGLELDFVQYPHHQAG